MMFAALIVSSATARASEPVEIPWEKVCEAARSRELVVKTVDGSTVKGYCVSIDVNEIAVNTSNYRVVKIARTALSRLEMRRSIHSKGHQLKSLRAGMAKNLWMGFDALLSPGAPIGIVVIPGTLAWGAVAAPFCLVGDLRAKVIGTKEIKVI